MKQIDDERKMGNVYECFEQIKPHLQVYLLRSKDSKSPKFFENWPEDL